MNALLAQATPLEQSIPTPNVEWIGVTPILVLIGSALLLLLYAALVTRTPPKSAYAAWTVVTSAVAGAFAVHLWQRVHDIDRGPFTAVAGALTIDGFTAFFTVLVVVAIALSALLCDDYLRRESLDGPELYVLMLLSAAGGLVMASANDLIVFFLGLEILSIALYVMAGFHLRRASSREAAMKYFVLGAFSSAFLLYGIALIYGATGTTNLARIAGFLATNQLESTRLLLAGFALLLVGLGFKTSSAPFHVWTPDVYQGSPSPVAGFMASASKAVAFAGLLRIFVTAFSTYRLDWQPIIWVLAVLTLAVGCFMAIVQRDVKRMMAYSSINHAGFVLVGVQAATDEGVSSALFYLLSYTFLIVGTFGVITLVGRRGDGHHDLDDYRGLAKRRPVLALVFAVFLFAQAGVPFTSGFLAKFYVISAAADAESYALALIAMLSSVVAAFLYLRVTVSMFMGADDEGEEGAATWPRIAVPAPAGVALAIALAFTLIVGVLPGKVVDFARDAVPVLISASP